MPKDTLWTIHVERGVQLSMEAYAEQFKPKWISVYDEEPPIHTNLLVKSNKNTIHIASWRSDYNIFDCQSKGESKLGWKWMPIPKIED